MLSIITKKTADLFIILALFPFVSFGTNTMDTQPHFILIGIFSLFFFILTGKVFSRIKHFVFFLALIFLILLIKSQNLDFILLRAFASYFAFFVTIVVSCIYIDRYGVPLRALVVANLIYIFAAIIQLNFNQHALNFLVVPNSFLDPSRGMSSLTPEPTFFAIVLFFWTWVYLVIYNYKPPTPIIILILINIFSIPFLAKSSMGIVFLVVSALFFLLNRLNKKKIIFYVIAVFIFFLSLTILLFKIFPESRLVNLIEIFLVVEGNIFNRLSNLIFFDASINDRVTNAIFPYLGFILNYGMPGGIDTFYDTSVYLSEYSNGYFWAGLGSNKILSFIGTFIYELGFISLFLFLYLLDFLRDDSNSNRLFEITLLFILLNSAISIAFPLIGILMAIMYNLKLKVDLQD